jgi:hypothetical protein
MGGIGIKFVEEKRRVECVEEATGVFHEETAKGVLLCPTRYRSTIGNRVRKALGS